MTITTVFESPARAASVACSTRLNASCCWSSRTNCSRSRISAAATASSCRLGAARELRNASAYGAPGDIRSQARPQEVDELRPPLAGKQPRVVRLGELPQRRHAMLGRVMQVRHPRNRVGVVLQRGQEVDEVLAVPADLLQRMQPGLVAVAVDHDHRRIVFVQLGPAPLLQLDDHIRSAPR